MAVDTTPTPDGEDIIDAEVIEPTRISRLREKAAPHSARARQVLAAQRARVNIRVSAWFSTADVTNAQLAAEIEKKRRQAGTAAKAGATAARDSVREQMAELKAQIEAAKTDEARLALVAQLAKLQAQAQAVAQAAASEDADRMKVSGRDIGRARWAKKAGRVGIVAAGTYAGFQGLAVEPLLALAALGVGGPAGWLYLGREFEYGEAPAAVVPQQGGAPGAVPAGAPETVPGAPFMPDTLAAMSRVSLVKPESGRVQGEADLVTALVKAGII
ncbi:hypothetical protein GT025_24230, partial [Streptomyces sp. SID4920]|nr:hypothetical protein [Streptomyces sp. SID4920]MYX67406.1 hypothetical protein [Streptomyces sp. SID8373]